MFDVVVVGSANVDLVASTPRIPSPGETVLGTAFAEHPGGKGLNQSVAASRAGARVAFIGAVGDDAAGQLVIDTLDADSIDRSGLRVIDGVPTGRALISVSAGGENSIIVVPGANGRLEPPDVLPAARVVVLQLEIPLHAVTAVARAARRSAAIVVLNPAPAPSDGLPEELLADCDVIVPNEHEVELLGGVGSLLDRGVGAVVVTRGGRGAHLHRASGRLDTGSGGTGPVTIEPFVVDPVDTTGAGDAFCGNLAAALAAGRALPEALHRAAAAGALATTKEGAVPSLPLARALDRLLDDA